MEAKKALVREELPCENHIRHEEFIVHLWGLEISVTLSQIMQANFHWGDLPSGGAAGGQYKEWRDMDTPSCGTSDQTMQKWHMGSWAWAILSDSLPGHLLRRSPGWFQGPGHLVVPFWTGCWGASQEDRGKLRDCHSCLHYWWRAHTSDIKEWRSKLCEMEVLSIGECSEACPRLERSNN